MCLVIAFFSDFFRKYFMIHLISGISKGSCDYKIYFFVCTSILVGTLKMENGTDRKAGA